MCVCVGLCVCCVGPSESNGFLSLNGVGLSGECPSYELIVGGLGVKNGQRNVQFEFSR